MLMRPLRDSRSACTTTAVRPRTVCRVFALLPFAVGFQTVGRCCCWRAAAGAIGIHRFGGSCRRSPLAVARTSLWLSLCITSIYLGELIPVFVCALAATAYCVKKGPVDGQRAVCTVLTLVEPASGGLSVCASMALWAPRSRAAIAIGLSRTGPPYRAQRFSTATALEYIRRIVPLHALSELGSDAHT